MCCEQSTAHISLGKFFVQRILRFIDSSSNSALSPNHIRSLRRQLSWRWGLGIHPKQAIHTLRLFLHNWLTDKSDSFTDILKYDLERSHSGASGFQKARLTFFIRIKENYCLHDFFPLKIVFQCPLDEKEKIIAQTPNIIYKLTKSCPKYYSYCLILLEV